MLPRNRAVTARFLGSAPITRIRPPKKPPSSTIGRDVHRPLSSSRRLFAQRRPSIYTRFPSKQSSPPPPYTRFPSKQSPPPPNDGRLFPNSSQSSRRLRELLWYWQTNPRFRNTVLVIVVGGGIFYVYNLERVPVTGRLRFNCIPEEWEKSGAMQQHKQLLQQYGGRILPPSHPTSRMVQGVLDRLGPVSGGGDVSWEAVVIDDPDTINAFVTSG